MHQIHFQNDIFFQYSYAFQNYKTKIYLFNFLFSLLLMDFPFVNLTIHLFYSCGPLIFCAASIVFGSPLHNCTDHIYTAILRYVCGDEFATIVDLWRDDHKIHTGTFCGRAHAPAYVWSRRFCGWIVSGTRCTHRFSLYCVDPDAILGDTYLWTLWDRRCIWMGDLSRERMHGVVIDLYCRNPFRIDRKSVAFALNQIESN